MSSLIPPPLSDSAAINLRRLLLLRAFTLVGLGLTLAYTAGVLGLSLPVGTLAAILAAMAGVSLATLWRLRRGGRTTEAGLFGQLLLDVAMFTALFYFSGGSTNPLVMLFLLPLAIAAASLPAGYVWGMAAIATACYSGLLVWQVPLPHAAHLQHIDFGMHVLGMWLGFVLSAGLIAGFSAKMSNTLREHEQALSRLREQALRQERVVALGTLATGAAHELGTPLSTMAVLVKDIEPQHGVSPEKLAILRAQIARCKEILASLSSAAGQMRAEAGRGQALDVFLDELIQRWRALRPGVQATVRLAGTQPAPRIVAEQTLAQAITNILNNAADASPTEVAIDGRWTRDQLLLEIADRGPGLSPDIAPAAGSAFLTTKTDGLGLGLFLAYTTFSRFGGEVHLLNRDGGGVLCRLQLPLAALRVDD